MLHGHVGHFEPALHLAGKPQRRHSAATATSARLASISSATSGCSTRSHTSVAWRWTSSGSSDNS